MCKVRFQSRLSTEYVLPPLPQTNYVWFGWRNTYYFIGTAGLIFTAIWQLFAAAKPAHCTWISQEEKEFLEVNVIGSQNPTINSPEKKDKETQSFSVWMLLHPSLLAIFLSHMVFNFGTYTLNNWLPIYYNDVLKLAPVDSKLHMMLPHVLNLVVKRFVNGNLDSYLMSQGKALVYMCGCIVYAATQFAHTLAVSHLRAVSTVG